MILARQLEQSSASISRLRRALPKIDNWHQHSATFFIYTGRVVKSEKPVQFKRISLSCCWREDQRATQIVCLKKGLKSTQSRDYLCFHVNFNSHRTPWLYSRNRILWLLTTLGQGQNSHNIRFLSQVIIVKWTLWLCMTMANYGLRFRTFWRLIISHNALKPCILILINAPSQKFTSNSYQEILVLSKFWAQNSQLNLKIVTISSLA